MKTQLTKEQSQHLIDLGVPREKASGIDIDNFDNMVLLAAEAMANSNRDKTIRSLSSPIFKLDDLLEILPKEIKGEEVNNEYKEALLSIDYMDKGWNCAYNGLVYKGGISYNKELIDALYELTVWCLGKKYLKFD